MLFLPRSLAALAALCDEANPRYALGGVRVFDPQDTTFRAEVTDGRCALIARGNTAPDPAGAEAPPGAEGGGPSIVIPRGLWTDGLTLGKKDRLLRDKPVGLAIAPAGDRATFFTPAHRLEAGALEGRFPPVEEVVPRKAALFTISVQTSILVEVLQALAKAGAAQKVTLHFYGPDKVMGLSARTEAGVYLDALLMPLTP